MWKSVIAMALLSAESPGTDLPRRVELDIDPQVMAGIGVASR